MYSIVAEKLHESATILVIRNGMNDRSKYFIRSNQRNILLSLREFLATFTLELRQVDARTEKQKINLIASKIQLCIGSVEKKIENVLVLNYVGKPQYGSFSKRIADERIYPSNI